MRCSVSGQENGPERQKRIIEYIIKFEIHFGNHTFIHEERKMKICLKS